MSNFYANVLIISRFAIFLTCFFIGLAVFIIGFIPTSVSKLKPKSTDSIFSECVNITQSPDICSKFNYASYPKRYENVVLVVIDALRADFIPSINNNPEFDTSLPFTEKLIKQKFALPFISEVHSPTVTLPRIKSLVTGGISNFMDVLMNLNAEELREDNILHQGRAHNLKAVFYGDNTWLKLFPDLFTRSEGTHSFFVSDFQEVDHNVTENMKPEFFKLDDWDIMILHYLGVDHIGHAYGPHSQYLAPKLKEMDDVIKFIYESLLSQKKFHSLIVICGDHGMTSSGSHGGISKAELLTPLIFINMRQYSHDYDVIKTINQVDIAPTLSVLLDLPIPVNNFGNVLEDVLDYCTFDHLQILHAKLNNLIQLFNVHKSVFPKKAELYGELVKSVITNHSEALLLSKWFKYSNSKISKYPSILKLYTNLLNEMKQDLITNTMGYNDIYIASGLIMIWLFFTCTVISYLIVQSDNSMIGMLFSTIKSPLLIVSILPILLLAFFFKSNAICIIYIGMVIIHLSIWIIRFLIKNLHLTFMGKSCTFFLFLHAVSLFSSSYIEEEHQVWYFLISTTLTLYFVMCLCSAVSDFLKLEPEKQTIASCIWKILCHNKNFSKGCLLLVLLVSHRVLRYWNQTGNKWQHLPDISDWLDKEDNVVYASLLVVMSQILIITCIEKVQNVIIHSAMCLSMVLIYLYHCHNVMLSLSKTLNVDLIFVPWTVYYLIFVIILAMLFQTWKDGSKLTIIIIIAWILLIQLIGRSHNIPLIAGTLLQEKILHKILWINRSENMFRISCYLIMAMGSFFYLGNSNSLSTIDVNSGYVGLLSYQPVIVGLLITCNTYSTVVLWIMLLIYRMQMFISSEGAPQPSSAHSIFHSFVILLMYKIFVLAIYCIVMFIMKHHLFFLSVFAPKIFYEICHVILIMIFVVILMITKI